jgi:hypothetical protein
MKKELFNARKGWYEVKPEEREYAVFAKGKTMYGGTAGMMDDVRTKLTKTQALKAVDEMKTKESYSEVGIYKEVKIENYV